MKRLLTLTIALFAVNAMAINVNSTWYKRGERLKFIKKMTRMNTTFASKEAAVQAAFDFAEELQGGAPSNTSMRRMDRSQTLHSDLKCQSLFGLTKRIVIGEMAAGKFQVSSVKYSSYINAEGNEIYSSSITYYAPCVLVDRD